MIRLSRPIRAARGPRRRRRGLTLLEVVLASVLLAGLASTLMSAMAFVMRSEVRFAQQLAATEVANRLLLQYLDDPTGMPDQKVHYFDGTYNFRWSLSIEPVKIAQAPERPIMAPPTTPQGQQALDASKILRARVFLGVSDRLGGYTFGEQLAELTRPFNPVAAEMRNPDVVSRLSGDTQRLGRFVEKVLALTEGTGGGGSGELEKFSGGGGTKSTGVWAGDSGTARPFGNASKSGGGK